MAQSSDPPSAPPDSPRAAQGDAEVPEPALVEPDVFDYLDYRSYLRDYYAYRKRKGAFSYRAFSMRAKLKSPNYLKLVIDGERNLSPATAQRFASACGLAGQAAAFLGELIAFSQAETIDERNEVYARVRRFRQYREGHQLQIAAAEYHVRWYLPAVRELAMAVDFQPDAEWIAKRLVPQIKVAEAQFALDTLRQLGMLLPDGSGRLKQGTPLVSTGAETAAMHMVNYHRTMMQLASESLGRVAPAQRDISSVTLCLGPEGLGMIKQAIVRFRRELLELSELEKSPEQVVQVNFQLFPLSSKSPTGGS